MTLKNGDEVEVDNLQDYQEKVGKFVDNMRETSYTEKNATQKPESNATSLAEQPEDNSTSVAEVPENSTSSSA